MLTFCHKLAVSLLLLVAVAPAQTSDLEATASDGSPTLPTVTFALDFPNATPPHYSISVDSTGRAAYRSSPLPDRPGDPYSVKFVVSEPTRARVFDFAQKLNYFKGAFEYKKGRIAFSGAKTLSFHDGRQENATTYNWSDNPLIQQLTTLFQNLSLTLEFGRELDYLYRHDRLGIDAELRKMMDVDKGGEVVELQAIAPILQRIADDSSVIHIARQRARTLLSKAQPASTTTSQNRR